MKETSKERLISALCAVASIGAFLLIWYLACALTALGKLLPDPVTVLVRVVIQHFLKTIVVQFVFEVIG